MPSDSDFSLGDASEDNLGAFSKECYTIDGIEFKFPKVAAILEKKRKGKTIDQQVRPLNFYIRRLDRYNPDINFNEDQYRNIFNHHLQSVIHLLDGDEFMKSHQQMDDASLVQEHQKQMDNVHARINAEVIVLRLAHDQRIIQRDMRKLEKLRRQRKTNPAMKLAVKVLRRAERLGPECPPVPNLSEIEDLAHGFQVMPKKEARRAERAFGATDAEERHERKMKAREGRQNRKSRFTRESAPSPAFFLDSEFATSLLPDSEDNHERFYDTQES